MKEVRFFYVPEADRHAELPQEEAQHAARVLRLQAGDEVYLMDGVGNYYLAELTLMSQKHCLYNIKEVMPQKKGWKGEIHLAIAPTKNIDRIEWIAEKCTEIGWDSVQFLDCKFSERHQIRTDRIEKIIVSAVKQSRKPFMPKVTGMTRFEEAVASPPAPLLKARGENGKIRNFICHCYPEIPRKDLNSILPSLREEGQGVRLFVGPEGDFSIDEVRFALEHGFESVTLGDFRLRTETAGLVAVTLTQLALRNNLNQ